MKAKKQKFATSKSKTRFKTQNKIQRSEFASDRKKVGDVV